MKTIYSKMEEKFSSLLYLLKDVPLLLIRMVLAYGFYMPAKMKLENINDIASWFESINIPFPTFSAYLAAGSEGAGVILLSLGLGTRIISIPLSITMVVAIVTVHWANGFQAGDNGYEIPLYYLIMLFTLFVYGAGKLSIDNLISRARGKHYEFLLQK